MKINDLTNLKKSNIFNLLFSLLILICLLFLYWQNFNNFFFGDDFYNLILSRVNNTKEVFNFFNPLKSPKDFPFYRPLTTQFYFWLGEKLFGLNPIGYHAVNFIVFLLTIVAVFRIMREITDNKNLIYLTTFFYSFSSSHFYRLFFIAQIQEIALAALYLFCVISYLKFLKNRNRFFYLLSIIFLILSLTAKETAITLPLILILIDLLLNMDKLKMISWFKSRLILLTPFFIIVSFYLLLRIFFFGFSKGIDYQFVFNFKSIINNVVWYILWSVGLPEHYVNIPLLRRAYLINPDFLTNVTSEGAITTLFFTIFLCLISLSIKYFFNKKKFNSKEFFLITFSFLWFLITLSLVMFFPFHKFSYSLTLPLFGISLFLAILVNSTIKFSKFFFFITLLIYLLANFWSINFAIKTHWSVSRARIAKNVFKYFKTNYSSLPKNSIIYFSDVNYCTSQKIRTEESKQISLALVNDKGFYVLYNRAPKTVYFQNSIAFEDLITKIGTNNLILVQSGCFINKI